MKNTKTHGGKAKILNAMVRQKLCHYGSFENYLDKKSFEKWLIPLLSDDLLSTTMLKMKGKRKEPHKTFGHCYVLSEVAYCLLGGKKSGYVPQYIKHEGMPHWYLKHKESGCILDLSAEQFNKKPNYKKGRGIGFLTKKLSKRAKLLIDKLIYKPKSNLTDHI